jgi:hypothetical protein
MEKCELELTIQGNSAIGNLHDINPVGKFISGLEELSLEEAKSITGGESLWYWLGYGVGYFSYTVTRPNGEQSAGQNLMNTALG